jgi:tetratricopeptide (TPR) repeat protein
VKGSTLAALLTLLLVVATVGQAVRWRNRMTANRLLGRVEQLTLAAYRYGQAPVKLMADNLETLRRAAPLDPVEVGIPMARGTQYLFLARFEPAISSYQEAVALEPQSAGYFALGRAQWLAGRQDEARASFAVALRLDPSLASQLPPGVR